MRQLGRQFLNSLFAELARGHNHLTRPRSNLYHGAFGQAPRGVIIDLYRIEYRGRASNYWDRCRELRIRLFARNIDGVSYERHENDFLVVEDELAGRAVLHGGNCPPVAFVKVYSPQSKLS